MNRRMQAVMIGAALFSASTFASAGDVGVGVGISYVFGGGIAVGVKAFSDNEDNQTVGSVGIDYLFETQSFRPNIGAAYLGEGYFSGGDVGYNFDTKSLDFGIGAGWSNSDDKNKQKPPAPAPIPVLT